MSSPAMTAMPQEALQGMTIAGFGGGEPPSAFQAQQFEALMQQATMVPPQSTGGGGSTISEVSRALDSEARQPFLDMVAFQQQIPSMSLVQMNEAHDRIVMEAATANFDLDAATGVVKAANTALSTLVRNQ
jgi:type III secretion system HrpB2-like protein